MDATTQTVRGLLFELIIQPLRVKTDAVPKQTAPSCRVCSYICMCSTYGGGFIPPESTC